MMHTRVIIAAILLLIVGTRINVLCKNEHLESPDEICSESEWRLFKEKYSKNYDSNLEEDANRMKIFCNNLRKVQDHNANPNATYQMGLNHLADKIAEELEMMMPKIQFDVSVKRQFLSSSKLLQIIKDINIEPPAELDYSKDLQRVSPARSQGDCGACWAFSIVAMLEGQQVPLGQRKLVPLSEQNMLDCDKKNRGCNGGLYPDALSEIKRYGGLMKRIDYPFVSDKTGVIDRCRMERDRAFETTVDLGETLWVAQGNETLLKQIVANYGPVPIYMHAKPAFLVYQSGIYYDEDYSNEDSWNHGVVIVGYGTDKLTGRDFWKIKNSWSDEWGQQGFGLMSRNRDNNCGIASYAYISLPANQV